MPETTLSSCTWEWKEAALTSDGWHICHRFPTTIHQELLSRGDIPDPDIGLNELDVQWVGERDWAFRTSFQSPDGVDEFDNVVLALDGIDTVATISLNSKQISRVENMFIPHRICVKHALKPGGETNSLELSFESANRVGEGLRADQGDKFSAIGDSTRLFVRKAQYSWGWDFAPILLTCGPYKDIRLEWYQTRIVDLHAQADLSDDFLQAVVHLNVELGGSFSNEIGQVKLAIHGPDGESWSSILEPGVTKTHFTIDEPQLWWPAGDGGQPLYTASAYYVNDKVTLSSKSISFGIRQVRLIQRPLQSRDATSFFFQVNGRPTLALGNNWIPAHSYIPSIDGKLYEDLLLLARRNNNNMLRVWGGGFYEADLFYELCDRLGIMVWQDFMFTCGDYSVHPSYLASVATEVDSQVRRLRNHPSIVLWCGNNEDLMFAELKGKKFAVNDITGPWPDDELPHRTIYFKIIPRILDRLSPNTPYHPTSPFGGLTTNDRTKGDIHMWKVYHGDQRPYQDYPLLMGSFVSEFGMHAFPNIRTVKYFAPKATSPQSRVVDFHNKGRGAERRLGTYLSENFRVNWRNMEDFIYATQLLQSEALGYALKHWRRAWAGPGREGCGGMLIWQLNDVYPTTSWSLLDSFLRPKAAFYTTSRHFQTHTVGIARTPAVSSFAALTTAPNKDPRGFEIWGANRSSSARAVILRLRLYDFAAQKYQELPQLVKAESQHVLLSNQSTELVAFKLQGYNAREGCDAILAATLHDPATGEEIARDVSWPEPFRYLEWPHDTQVEIQVAPNEEEVSLAANYPVKGVLLYVDLENGEDAVWMDNMLDILPEEQISVGVQGLHGRGVKARWYGSEEL